MAQIQTATGPIETSQLGPTLMHEHVALVPLNIRFNLGPEFDRGLLVQRASERLKRGMQSGIRTIVDLTAADLDRDAELIAEVSRETGCNIVVATGAYLKPPAFITSAPMSWIVDLWTREIRQGVPGTSVRAGIIKLATGEEGVTRANEKMLRAGARVHRATGVPISTHTDAHTRRGEDQQRIFAEEGVDLGRVVLGHSGDSTDLDYLRGLIERGSYIGMDRFGMEEYCPFEDRINTVAALCRLGYAERMVLSHDAPGMSLFPSFDLSRGHPNWNFHHVSDDVLPALRDRGVTDGQIEAMMVQNPRRIFEQNQPY